MSYIYDTYIYIYIYIRQAATFAQHWLVGDTHAYIHAHMHTCVFTDLHTHMYAIPTPRSHGTFVRKSSM